MLSVAAPAAVLAVAASRPVLAASPVTRLVIRLRLASRCASDSLGLASENNPVSTLDAAAPAAPLPQLWLLAAAPAQARMPCSAACTGEPSIRLPLATSSPI
ncbi:hypothetical protein D3C77_511670 [compost metagenome]